MGDLKPLGSEKLNGDEKLRRILELTYYNNNKNNTASQRAEYISESTTGVYGVVKEKDGYYVKKGLNESSLDYIGGMFMKNKNKFSSYAEALKRLELLKGQEMLQEDTKYVLKMGGKPAAENEAAPMPPAPPAPAPDAMPPAPAEVAAEMPPALPPADGEMSPDAMGDEAMPPAPEEDGEGAPEEGDDKMKLIQKLTGKLGQKIRDIQDELESDDIKYILNSVISAVNLDKLDADDKEEILGSFEDDEEGLGDEGDFGNEEDGGVPAEMPTAEPEGDLGEVDGIDALENLVNMNFEEGFDDFDTQIQPEEMRFDDEDEFEDEGPVGRHDALDSDIDLEKEKVRKKTKHYVEPDSDEDLYYRQASLDASNEFDSDADIYGDDDYGDMFNFDLKEEDPAGDQGGSLSDLYGDEIDSINNDIKSQDFYTDDQSSDDEELSVEPETKTKEIDINELTDIINNSVKETLRKHFE